MHFRSHHNGVVCVEAEEKSAGGIMTPASFAFERRDQRRHLIMYRVVTRRNNSALISSSTAPAFRFLDCRDFTKSTESRQ